MATPLSLLAYSALVSRIETPVSDRLKALRDQAKISSETYNERMAIALPIRPNGNLVWLHAGTQRSFLSAVELFRRLRGDRPDLQGLLTATFEPNASQYQPVEGLWITQIPEDSFNIADRFLSHWTPDCLLWIGGKFRPALLQRTHARDIPTLSIDAPESTFDLDVTVNIPGLRAATMRFFDHIITSTAARILPWRRAGVDPDRIEAHGFLEETTSLPRFNEVELNALSQEIGTRPVWFAANAAAVECKDILRAHKTALRRSHRMLLLLSSSDTHAAADIQAYCQELGLNAITRNDGASITEAVQVLIIEGRDEDGLWLRLAPVTFLGQSLSADGGIDPYPAATFGSAMLHGPHVTNFANAYDSFRKANATLTVHNCQSLAQGVTDVLAADVCANMAHAAWDVCSAGAEVTDRVTNLVHDILDVREEMKA
jgi:3-deoxy-D-manno-octulosonic-acid transferase